MGIKITKDIRLWGNFYGFVIQGMIVTVFGTVMSYIRQGYHLSYTQGGLVLSVLAAGNLVFSFVSGVLSDWVGRKNVILLGNLCYIVGLGLIAFSNDLFLLYAGAFITGAGWGTCNTGINMVINQLVQGDGKTLNLLHMTYGIGAFLIPLLAGTLMRAGWRWRNVLLLLLGLAVLALVFALRMPETPKPVPQADSGKTERTVSRSVFLTPALYLFMLMAFFYEGAENSLSGWIVTYLMSRGLSEIFSQNMLSVFWVAVICGRCLNGVLSRKIGKPALILGSSVGALAAVVLFVNVSAQAGVACVVALAGLMLSGIYPLTIACAHSIMSESGTAGAMITSIGGLGASVVPFAGGKAAESVGTSGIIAAVVISILLLAAASAVNFVRSRSGSRIQTE